MNAKDFEIKTAFYNASNPAPEGTWPVAIDVGYSSVKGFSKNHIFSFPTFIRKADEKRMIAGKLEKNTIQYKDEFGNMYDVGARAYALSEDDENSSDIDGLYLRNRYSTDLFKIVSRVAMAIALHENKHGKYNGETIYLQTGLPSTYDNDINAIKKAFAGTHKFSIRFGGRSEWTEFEYTLDKENIFVMPQPMGSLWCSVFDGSGNPIEGSDKFLGESTIIFDGGFGTLDVHFVNRLSIESYHTFSEYGMRSVFAKVAEEFLEKYNCEIKIPLFQKYLSDGFVKCYIPTEEGQDIDLTDISTYTVEPIYLDDIIKRHSEEVAREAIKAVVKIKSDIRNYKNVIITGGCGDAWGEQLETQFKHLDKNVIRANKTESSLPSIFNNARGYYLYLVNKIKFSNKGE